LKDKNKKNNNNENEYNVIKPKTLYTQYNTHNTHKGLEKDSLDFDLQSYREKLLQFAKMNRRHVDFYISSQLWEEFNRVVKSVDPFLSRSQVLEQLIIDYCLRNNSKNLKITQFIFNQPQQVNIQPKVEVNIAQKLELKLVTQDLAGVLDALEKRRGDSNFYMSRLREVLPRAIRVYERVRDEELRKLLAKAEKWVEGRS